MTINSFLPEINSLLEELLKSVQAIVGSRFIGMYLDGSLASGDFDQDSDIDFVVVLDEEVSTDLFAELKRMHERIARMDTVWAIQLEGTYISRQALRRFDPVHGPHPNIERGRGECLKWVQHDDTWNIHRYVLRDHGITLVGPPPQTLVDPVLPAQLQQAMRTILTGWAAKILDEPAQMKSRGYQSYTVLSLCRILYTLQFGAVVSKPVAARWAQETLGLNWAPLIERAWEGRHNPGIEASVEDVNGTLDFIRFALERPEFF